MKEVSDNKERLTRVSFIAGRAGVHITSYSSYLVSWDRLAALTLLERGLRAFYKEESSPLYTGLEEDLQPQLKNLPIQTESFQTYFQFLFQCIISPDFDSSSSGTSIARGTSTYDVGWDQEYALLLHLFAKDFMLCAGI